MKFFERPNQEPKNEETVGEPVNYSVDFNVSEATGLDGKSDTRDLTKLLEAASGLWKDRKKPASGVSGFLAKARSDYKRLLDTLYGEGRYGGSISITADGREVAGLPPDAELSQPVKVRVSVDPGPPFVFGRTEIVNEAPPTADRRDKVPLPEKEGFVPGQLARSGTILKADRLATEAWRQQGYPKAEVATQRVVAAHRTSTVDATIEVEPGRKAYYGPVTVKGTDRMNPAFVAWMAGLPLGQEYDPDDIDRANKRLMRLGVFRSARFEEANAIEPDGTLPMSLIVQEQPLHRFGIGADYSTVDGGGFQTYWLHRNLFGHAESLKLEAKVAGFGNTADPADFTYRVGATFTRPGVFTPDTDFVASVIGDREVLDIYTRTSITGLVGFNRIFTDELSGKLFLTGGPSRFDDDFGKRDFLDVGVLGGLTYDTRDSKVDPTTGYYLDGTVQPFYEFNYGNPAVRMVAEGRAYYGFGEDRRIVLAGRLKVGSIVGPPIAETAPDKLFLAGGGGSVRGYAYRNIGITLPGGIVTGGRSLVETSAELRARITDTIGVVGFIDAGYVGANSLPDFSEKFRIGVGGGVRYFTGLGPLRADVAFPLDRRPGDPTVAFYIGLGQAF
ncbi:MAG: outer membrane protein assembly factor [Rhizobiales bacterium]|nr:outer membrane protein assembly factor [Hyphomicrobiales bacterium]